MFTRPHNRTDNSDLSVYYIYEINVFLTVRISQKIVRNDQETAIYFNSAGVGREPFAVVLRHGRGWDRETMESIMTMSLPAFPFKPLRVSFYNLSISKSNEV